MNKKKQTQIAALFFYGIMLLSVLAFLATNLDL